MHVQNNVPSGLLNRICLFALTNMIENNYSQYVVCLFDPRRLTCQLIEFPRVKNDTDASLHCVGGVGFNKANIDRCGDFACKRKQNSTKI